ncbi:MAG: response regulator [Betaproteobacteria bacterium]|nr:response regulator [Betaproteobacteria bacterium]
MSEAAAAAQRATILVVDDSPQNLSLMSGLLEDLYTVKLAPSGARALKIAAANPLDLILLDIMMPEMDGYDVCRLLKENPDTRHIPVIFLTAMDGMADEEKGLLAGAVDYITKPISPPILLARVRNQLALKEAIDQLRQQTQLLEQEKLRSRELLLKLKQASDKLLEHNRLLKQENVQAMQTMQAAAQKAQTPAEAVQTPAGGMEQRTLGRYHIERELGRGAMGTVYLGTDPKIGRVVAIKTMSLPVNVSADKLEEIKERFFREAESAGRLTHPNIVAIYDVGEQHDLAYIAMEFLHGQDLALYARPDHLLPLEKVLSIGERVALALAYAHEHNVVHRDIKPANVVYEADSDSVKVTDFGIASITDSLKTDSGIVLGTPSYMSPEQVAGSIIDGRSDLYSLGVMIYALVTGRLPFQGETLAQLMLNIAHEPYPDIRTYNAEFPDCVAALLNTALAKDPAQRYQRGELMAKALNLCRRSLMVFTK